MDIIKASYLISSPKVDLCPAPDRPEFAFIGRSNVGKSSLINMLCNQSRLAKTSTEPGKTQSINHFEVVSRSSLSSKKQTPWYLVDLPGYGYAKVSQKQRTGWEKMIEEYLRNRTNLLNVFVLLDARHKPQQADLDFIAQLGEWQVPFCLVFTKSDKVKPGALKLNIQLFSTAMQQQWTTLPPAFISSATTRAGKEDLLAYIQHIIKESGSV
jgi:GTP-binding protein